MLLLTRVHSQLDISEIRRAVSRLGLKLLSKEVGSGLSPTVQVACAAGHVVRVRCSSVMGPSWSCPKCQPSRSTHTIDEMKGIAKSRGYECLSTTYKNNKTKLRLYCKKHGEWLVTPNWFLLGSGCPGCGGSKKRSMADVNALARERDIKCLSKTYKNNRSKLLWKCGVSDHKPWRASYHDVKSGRGCRICGYARNAERRRLKLAEIERIAKRCGLRLISGQSYISVYSPMKWQCLNNPRHKFETKFVGIKYAASGCPICYQETFVRKNKANMTSR